MKALDSFTLKAKMHGSLTLTVLLCILIVSSAAWYYHEEQLESNFKQLIVSETKSIEGQIEGFFEEIREDIAFIESSPLTTDFLDAKLNDSENFEENRQNLIQSLSALKQAKPFISKIAIIGMDGKSTLNLSGPDKNWLQAIPESVNKSLQLPKNAITSSKVVLMNYASGKNPEIFLGSSLFSNTGDRLGGVILGVSINYILQKIPRVTSDGTQNHIIDARGYFLRTSKPEFENQFSEKGKNTVNRTFSKVINSIKSDSNIYKNDKSLEYYLSAATVYPDPQNKNNAWRIVRTSPKSIVWNQEIDFIQSILAISVICFTLSFGLALLFVRLVINPIQGVFQHLDTISTSTAKSSKLILSSSEKVEDASKQQATAIHETVSAMSEMTSMVSGTIGQIDKALLSAKSVSIKTSSGQEIMDHLLSLISKLSDSMKEIQSTTEKFERQSSKQMADMAEIIENVSEKTQIINDIVKETKLLSFNASIEAARAGQYGKGFAVVAQEVGNLASMSGKASEEIGILISDSKSRVSNIIDMTKDGVDVSLQKVSEGNNISEEVRTVCKKAHSTFVEIAKEIKHISSDVDSVKNAADEQSKGLDQMSVAMKQIDSSAQKSRKESDNNSVLADVLMKHAHQLNNVKGNMEGIVLGENAKKKHEKEEKQADSKQSSTKTDSEESDDAVFSRFLEKLEGKNEDEKSSSDTELDSNSDDFKEDVA